MKVRNACLVLALIAISAEADDSFNSEFSHFVGGAVMGAGFTAVADYYGYREHRGWIGFGIAAGIGIAGELYEVADGQGGFGTLDATVNALGAALGAYATDEWVLVPVIYPESGYVGLVGRYHFR